MIINILIFVVFELDLLFLMFGVFCVGFVSFIKFFVDKMVVDNVCMNNVLSGFIDSLFEIEDCKVCILLGCYGWVEEVSFMISYLVGEGIYVMG